MSELKPCPMRAENGNCSPVGGFCTSVPELYCEAANRAYQTGYHDGATEAMRRAQPANEPLTLEQLREMDGEPVWVTHKDGSGGRWGIVNKYKGSGMCADLDAYTAYWFDDYCGTIAYEHKPEEVQQ